jgi:hypothetical protein
MTLDQFPEPVGQNKTKTKKRTRITLVGLSDKKPFSQIVKAAPHSRQAGSGMPKKRERPDFKVSRRAYPGAGFRPKKPVFFQRSCTAGFYQNPPSATTGKLEFPSSQVVSGQSLATQ